jgi:hypothetical protein
VIFIAGPDYEGSHAFCALLYGSAIRLCTGRKDCTGYRHRSFGVVVTRAAVVVKQASFTQSTHRDTSGIYRFASLPAGNSRMKIETAGFRHNSAREVAIAGGKTFIAEVRLILSGVPADVVLRPRMHRATAIAWKQQTLVRWAIGRNSTLLIFRTRFRQTS